MRVNDGSILTEKKNGRIKLDKVEIWTKFNKSKVIELNWILDKKLNGAITR